MNNSKYVPQEPATFGFPSAPMEAVAPPAENYPPSLAVNNGPPTGNHPLPPVNYAPAPGNYPAPSYAQQAYPQHAGYPPQLHPAAVHAQQVYVQPPYPTQNYQLPTPGAAPPQHYYGPVPPPPPPEQPQHIGLERPTNWYTRMRMNRPQTNVLAAGKEMKLQTG